LNLSDPERPGIAKMKQGMKQKDGGQAQGRPWAKGPNTRGMTPHPPSVSMVAGP